MTTEEQYPELPEPFLSRMERLLGEEYQAFFRSYSDERTQGLRLNPLKSGGETDIEKLTALFGLRKVHWAKEGYYYQEETRPGKHVFHDAGVFYIQEPSAMAAAELLVANEIHPARARILSHTFHILGEDPGSGGMDLIGHQKPPAAETPSDVGGLSSRSSAQIQDPLSRPGI